MGRVISIGSINMDVVAKASRIPTPGETILGSVVEQIPGGKGANQAVAARRSGAECLMVGAVGNDAFASTLLEFLGGELLDMSHVARVNGSSGTALIVVDETGENVIVIVPGANDHVTAELISQVTFAHDDVILLQNEVPEGANESAIRAARDVGATTIWNMAPFRDAPEDLVKAVDYLVVNETEYSLLVQQGLVAQSTHLIKGLLAEGAGPTSNTVVTVGSEGLLARLDGKVIAIPGHPVKAVDTTGAGDCFCGSFGAALARGVEPIEALRFANSAAAISVQRFGAGPSMPRFAEVQSFIDSE